MNNYYGKETFCKLHDCLIIDYADTVIDCQGQIYSEERGEVTVSELNEIHNKMKTMLGLEGSYIDGLYYCPHHPHSRYEGEIPELKFDCDCCRKPKPGMLLKAAEDFNIDLSRSWMVGDGENDIKAGLAAGCKTVLINDKIGSYGQNMTVESLLDFAECLKRNIS